MQGAEGGGNDDGDGYSSGRGSAGEAERQTVLPPLVPEETATQAQIEACSATVMQLLATTQRGEIAVTQLMTASKEKGATKTLRDAQVEILLNRMILENRIMLKEGTIYAL